MASSRPGMLLGRMIEQPLRCQAFRRSGVQASGFHASVVVRWPTSEPDLDGRCQYDHVLLGIAVTVLTIAERYPARGLPNLSMALPSEYAKGVREVLNAFTPLLDARIVRRTGSLLTLGCA